MHRIVLALLLFPLCSLADPGRPAPFGDPLDSCVEVAPAYPCGDRGERLGTWRRPSPRKEGVLPLRTGGGILDPAAAERVNGWFTEGSAAGLSQDTFRSYDGAHSGLKLHVFPEMRSVPALKLYVPPCPAIFAPQVTFGVQSFGVSGEQPVKIVGRSVIEQGLQNAMRRVLAPGRVDLAQVPDLYRSFYENNFLLAAPAVGTFTPEQDSFSVLSPYYLHSIGASGSDARLLTPIVCAAAALHPDLKTRILRGGLYVPTLLYLFKSQFTGDLRDPAAHVPAYPPWTPASGEGRFEALSGRLVDAAHGLEHIPPVARLRYTSVAVKGAREGVPTYLRPGDYLFAAALRKGETLELTIDLSDSWRDEGRALEGYYAAVLRGEGEVTRLNETGSLVGVTIPWTLTPVQHDYRTDVLFLVNDGTYDSAPAYVSVCHLHPFSPIAKGIRAQ